MKEYVPFIIENGIIPVSLTIIESVVKSVYKQKTGSTKETNKIKKLIEKAVGNALPRDTNKNITGQIVDAIYYKLPDYSPDNIICALKRIIKDWPDAEYSFKCKEIANNVSINLACNFFETPELRIFIAINGIIQVKGMLDENNPRVAAIEKKVDNISMTLESFIKNCKMIQHMSRNSFVIAEEYQTYFSKELFLERNQPDGKIAYLKDVYIENDFVPLDLYPTEIDVGLIDFVSEFVNDNILRKYYKTLYATDSGSLKLLIVKGQPGSGKSSLFYALAHKKTHDLDFLPGISFYFVKLIELYSSKGSRPSANPLRDILDSLELTLPKEKCVFVLDGLDEICALTRFDSEQYCEELTKEACHHKNVKVILTTRLNYVNVSHENNKNVFNIQLKPLSEGKLRQWVEAYFGVHTGLGKEKSLAIRNVDYIGKYKDGKAEDIKEIVAIPLLFYMIVATSIDIQSLESVGQLYDMVFAELKSRRYNDNEAAYIQNHAANNLLKKELPRRVAMSIATIMYKNNDPLIKVNSKELEKSIKQLQIEYHLNRKEKENLEKLFPITFYYKKTDDVVEFAHRSIMEFFAAEQLYVSFCACKTSLLDYVVNYMTKPIVWGEVASFFSYFWNTRRDERVVDHYARTLEDDFTRITSPEVSLQVCDASYSYESNYLILKIFWFLAHDILGFEEQLGTILSKDYYITYIGNILSTKITDSSSFFDQSVHPWNFSGIKVDRLSISCGDLSHVILDNSQIDQCLLVKDSLQEASFNGASIRLWEFNQCELTNTQIDLDNVEQITFKNSIISQTIITGEKDIKRINADSVKEMDKKESIDIIFSEAIIKEVSFQSMSFDRVRVSNCYLESIRLKNALIELEVVANYWASGILTHAENIVVDLRKYKIHFDEKQKRFVSDCSHKSGLTKNASGSQFLTHPCKLVSLSRIDAKCLKELTGISFNPLLVIGKSYYLI